MRSLSVRARLSLWASAATSVTLAVVIGLVDVTFRANIRSELEEALLFARSVAEGARRARVDALVHETVTAAMDTRLRAAVATDDPATMSQTLDEVVGAISATWGLIVSPDGRVVASTPEAPDPARADVRRVLDEALFFDTGDLWTVDGSLVEVTASAILFGATPLAVLVSGWTLDQEEVSALEAGVGRPVALLLPGGGVEVGDEAATSWNVGASLGEVASRPDGVQALRMGEERVLAATMPLLSSGGERQATAVLLASLDEALAPSDQLRRRLGVIFLSGLGLTFAVAGLFSRAITVPVDRLLRETERLGRGDLENEIVPVRADEIGRLAESFDQMRVSLRAVRSELIRAERLSAIGNAASAVAHDFAQPLAVISGAVGLLRIEDEEEHREHCFEVIAGALDQLQRMKQEVVEFARGEVRLDREEIPIEDFLRHTVSGLEGELAEAGIRLTVHHGYYGSWSVDRYRLARVVENLVRNAAAVLREEGGGNVVVSSSSPGDQLVLEVEDNGPGIPPAILDDVFEPFVTAGKKDGTGLGLAIVRNVVELHGGDISVHSDGGGTLFTIVLPRQAVPNRRPPPVLLEATP